MREVVVEKGAEVTQVGGKRKNGKRYTLGEEIFNSVSHGVGAGLSIAALVIGIVCAAVGKGTALAVISAVMYGVSLIILYMSSTLYHALTNPTAKKVFRIFDHSSIFILIAGTYTPVTLVAFGGVQGVVWCCILWGLAILGIVLNAISIEKFKVLSMILYVAMGWAVVWNIKLLLASIPLGGIILIAAGGLCYTGGLIFYALHKHRYMHSIWHLFVLAGSVVQFLGVVLYIYG